MMVGSVHTIEYLEMLYWLDRTGYAGYLSLDQYPYREDPESAIAESIRWLQAMREVVDRAGHDCITGVIRRGDATEASRLVREAMFGRK
jgi:xylose isomerase